MRLGAHESIAGGVYRAFDRAASVGCDAVQIFVKPNRAWAAPHLADEDIHRFWVRAEETQISPVVAHTSYLLNLASPKDDLWQRSIDTLVLELDRCHRLGVPWLVLHPGAHVGTGEEAGLARVARGLGEVHERTEGLNAAVLLETMTGMGTKLGYRFEQLAWLREETPGGERLGVCLDTCHVFAAGYELRTAEGYTSTMEAFDSVIGLEHLKAIHLNDCKAKLGERRDRHEHIGKGHIGLAGFRRFVNDPQLAHVPGLLETPKSDDLHEDKENLAVLRGLIQSTPSGQHQTTRESQMDGVRP